jgi:hypothetical protein
MLCLGKKALIFSVLAKITIAMFYFKPNPIQNGLRTSYEGSIDH